MERGNSVSSIAPGWYRDPVDPTIQRYWDGEGYLGEPIPADATPPPGPPADATPPTAQNQGTPQSPQGTTPQSQDATQGQATQGLGTTQGQAAPQQGQAAPQQGQAAPQQGQSSPTATTQGQNTPAGVANSTQISAPPTSPQGPPAQGPYPPQGAYPPHGQYPPQAPYGTPPQPGQMPGWPAYPRLVLPAPRPHGYRLAGLGARFVARFVDILAVLGLNILVNGYFVYQYYTINLPYWQEISRRFYDGESMAGVEPPERSSTLLVIILILCAALWFAYEVPSHANTGQTLGKRLLGIKVMRLESDEALGFRRSIRRWNTIGLPTLLWTCFGLGFVLQLIDCLWAALDRPMHQALHDKSAVTVVVQAEPKPSAEQQTQPNHDQQGRPA